jgi:hypothetical protein
LKVLEENKRRSLKCDGVYDLINENNFNEMFLWMEYWKTIRFKKKKLKDFLMGRELILKSEGEAVESSFGGEVINVENVFSACFKGSVEYEYLKKFRFKFEGKEFEECNQLMMFEKYICVKKGENENKKRR